MRYSDLGTDALHVRAGGARAAAAALEPGRFDDADPDTERWSGSGRHHFQDLLPIAPAVMRSFRRRTQGRPAQAEPEGRRSQSFSMADSGRGQYKSPPCDSQGVLLGWSQIAATSRIAATQYETQYSPSIEPSWMIEPSSPDLDDAE